MRFEPSSRLLMIRPYKFGYNSATAVDNRFQHLPEPQEAISEKALEEFDGLHTQLIAEGIDVMVLQDNGNPPTPDSLFPNNWISFHEGRRVCLYPMYAPNRRSERKPFFLETIFNHIQGLQIEDWSHYETSGQYLEGTGSMVLDRTEKIAYACISERTDEGLFRKWCAEHHYIPRPFHATDEAGRPIYHTNVMMSIAREYAIICLECIRNKEEKELIREQLQNSGKHIIEISFEQLLHFAANVLQVAGKNGEPLLVMSEQAWKSFNQVQLKEIERYNRIVKAPLYTIEKVGGGGARCMLAEVFA